MEALSFRERKRRTRSLLRHKSLSIVSLSIESSSRSMVRGFQNEEEVIGLRPAEVAK
jgi:hypothetical protein